MSYDAVVESNNAEENHPVQFRQELRDTVSGFTGVVSSIGYKRTTAVVSLVRPSKKSNAVGDCFAFAVEDLVATDGSVIRFYVRPKLPVTLGAKYKDSITGFTGVATHIIFSANKCIQVMLSTGDDDNKPVSNWFDIQDIEALDEEAEQPKQTSDTNPGAPRVGRMAR